MDYLQAKEKMQASAQDIHLELDRLNVLLEELDHPERASSYVHIAGTNGKGSISAYLCSILRESGYRVGAYSSPAVYEYREQFLCDGTMITEEEYRDLAVRIFSAINRMEKRGIPSPSAFERETALAFLYFRDKACDIVVLECGMGGRTDATNVISGTELAVFSSISMDHSQWLGDDLYEIARVKAGIIKPGCDAVTFRQKPEVMRALEEECHLTGAALHCVEAEDLEVERSDMEGTSFLMRGEACRIHLAGLFQAENAATAVEAARLLAKRGWHIEAVAVKRGLETARWRGRLTRLRQKPDFILDGAHNEDAARRLAESVRFYYPNRRRILILAVFADKDYRRILDWMGPLAHVLICTQTPDHPRALPADSLARAASVYCRRTEVCADPERAAERALALAGREDVIISFGSLSNIAAISSRLQKDPEQASDLAACRQEIDRIDREIVGLFEERMRVVSGVAAYKIRTGREVFDPAREEEKLKALSAMAGSPFHARAVRELFHQIMAISRKRQYQILSEYGRLGPGDFREVDVIDTRKSRVVFQGLKGAYSFAAMKAFFDDSIESCHVETWRAAMEMVERGEADYAVLPIENSTAGIVSDVFDLLLEFDTPIVGDQIIPIEHCLMAVPGTCLKDIRSVISHPQGLAQCRDFLDRHPDWRQEAVGNTAMAAEWVAREGVRTQAAIAGRHAADQFGLEILEDRGLSTEKNSTRFIIVSGRKVYTGKSSRISLCVELPHESGSLYDILSHFIFNGLNMTRIESRPIPDRPFEYRFFIDFTGNLSESSVENALRGIREEAAAMRILGNY